MIENLKSLTDLSTEAKVLEIERFLRELCEHLNWQFENIGKENVSEELGG